MPRPAFAVVTAALFAAPAAAQDHRGVNHAGMSHGEPTVDGPRDMSEAPPPKRDLSPPRVFLEKSPRIVDYQLRRLDDARLLMVERNAGDAKFAPVYAAILARPGISAKDRRAALDALVTLNGSAPVTEILAALESLKEDDRRAVDKLTDDLVSLPAGELFAGSDRLAAAAESDARAVRVAGFAGLLTAGANTKIDPPGAASHRAWEIAGTDVGRRVDLLAAVSRVPERSLSDFDFGPVAALLDSGDAAVEAAAVTALATIPEDDEEWKVWTFKELAPRLSDANLRPAVVETLLTVPAEHRAPAVAADALAELLAVAESTAAADRTTDDFLNAMQLADGLLGRLPIENARPLRDRLREVAVRVVRVKTVEEEMRYDTAYFAVEAGRPVQILLENEDLMPHNLVLTPPGMLRQAAARGLEVGPSGGKTGLPYVSDGSEVLYATDLVDAGARERLTFTAPETPGEYPYVCTFPRHWPRMYGVMLVVSDLDEWLQNPTVPADPLGNDRTFVDDWQVADFTAGGQDLAARLEGRSPEIGQKIFTEAGCAQCHRVEGADSLVGPSLAGAFDRWKGDPALVLREILDPSAHIDPRYAVRTILTDEGQVFNGLVTAEDDAAVSVLVDPEAKEPTVIRRDAILDMAEADVSMMPKALMNRFTADEVLELLAYVRGLEPGDAPAGMTPTASNTPAERPPAGPRTKGADAVSGAGPPNEYLDGDRPKTYRELQAKLAEHGVEVFAPKVEPADGVREIAGLEYADRPTGRLALDLFLPAGIETAGEAPPLVVLIHGGGWRKGGRESERNKAVWFSNRGFAAAAVSYRLSPQAPFPAAIEDVRAAVRYLRDRAEDYGYDPNRVAAVGSSAGAHLAALLATAADPAAGQEDLMDAPSAKVQAAVVIAGPTDTESEQARAESRTPDNNYALFLGGSYDEVPDRYAAASPAHWATTDAPPLLLVGEGTMDSFAGLTGKLDKLGVSYDAFLLTGGIHGEWQWEPWFTPTMERIETFLDRAWQSGDVPGR